MLCTRVARFCPKSFGKKSRIKICSPLFLHIFSFSVFVSFSVTIISPSEGSLLGGLALSVQGTSLKDEVEVTIGGKECKFISGSHNDQSVICETPTSSQSHTITNGGRHSSGS